MVIFPGESTMTMQVSSPVHVVYRTYHFNEMLSWYASVFDATIQYQNPALAFLTYDDEHHRFAFADLGVIRPEAEQTSERSLVGVDHIAYEVDSLGSLLDSYASLKQKGIVPYWCVHHGMSVSLYYADPDGNQMEFMVDVFATKAEGTAYFQGNEIGDNPVGVEYDPEEWLKKLRNGISEGELLSSGSTGPVSPIRGEMLSLNA